MSNLASIDVSDATLFQEDKQWELFARLRAEDPIHFCEESRYGPYWSITKYVDIKWIDSHHDLFSSERDITIFDQPDDFELPMFIAMDQPKHHHQRKVVSPVVAPRNLAELEGTIRQRAIAILDSLSEGETFNWVDKVSIELTTQVLATLLDFPFEERHKLTRWSDVASGGRLSGAVDSAAARRTELIECLEYFQAMWQKKSKEAPSNDLISMLAHERLEDHLSHIPAHKFIATVAPFRAWRGLQLFIARGPRWRMHDTTSHTCWITT